MLGRLDARRRSVGVAVDEGAASRDVAGADQHLGDRVLAVAAGAADLLVVRLDRAGGREMDHGADVGPVDAHAEGVGRDDDLELAGGEGDRDLVAALAGEAGVVGLASPAISDQAVALDLGALAGRAVEDGGAAARAGDAEGFVEGVVDEAAAVGGFLDLGDPEREVRAGEAAHDLRGLGREAEARDDLVADVGGRGRGAGEDAGLGWAARTRPISRYSGRKSWPHSLMQWASSIAKRGQSSRRRISRKRGKTRRSGAT